MSYLANKKSRKIIAVAIILITILSGGVLCLKRRALPDPGVAPKEEITSFVASRDFMRMPEAERHQYMKKLKARGFLPYMLEPREPEKLENFRRHMEIFKQERLKKFYEMSPTEQEKALREAAEELKQQLAHKRNNQGNSGGARASHRKELEGQSPEERARTVDFAEKLKKYMSNNPNSGGRTHEK